MNIYVGNLAKAVTEEDLRQIFQEFGEVSSVKIISDTYSGESRGFGFVEMPDKAAANSAIEGLKDKDLKGRTITANEARPRPEARRGGEGHGFGGRGGEGRGPGGNRGSGSGGRGPGGSRGSGSGGRGPGGSRGSGSGGRGPGGGGRGGEGGGGRRSW